MQNSLDGVMVSVVLTAATGLGLVSEIKETEEKSSEVVKLTV
ncbi:MULTISPECIES: hypothetical protein [unclassified Undibacterium]